MTDDLVPTTPFDKDCVSLADRHYSRQTAGSNQFMGNGRKLVLRDCEGQIVFGWLWSKHRLDGESGFNCAIFRSETDERRGSDVILEAERAAVAKWGANRAFTYIDPRKVTPTMVRSHPVWGFCFYKAGWHFVRLSKDGKHLLEKQLAGAPHPEPEP